jgi:protein-tyrosine phosphatase
MGFAELHFHLLPGIDDGPRSLEESVELARLAAAEGTQTIVATPHVNSYFELDVGTLPERIRELAARLRQERVPVEVLCGGELAPERVGDLTGRQLETIAQGPPGRRWLLLEAPLSGLHDHFTDAAEVLRSRGFGVVIAHPERSLVEAESGWRVLERELRAGSAIQLNAWSLAGVNGERAREAALALLRAWPLAAVASDAHSPQRPPSLRLALQTLTELGERDPGRFVAGAPHALLKRGVGPRLPAIAA